jgi:hypothetical protein
MATTEIHGQDGAPPAARRTRGLGKMGIGRKLTLLVAVFVTIGLGALVALQFWNQRGDLMRDATVYNGIITRQLADAVSGGVKWEKADAIEKAYGELLGDAEAGLASIVIFKLDGSRMLGADATGRAAFDLSNVLADAAATLDAGGQYTRLDGDHMIVARPIPPAASGSARSRSPGAPRRCRRRSARCWRAVSPSGSASSSRSSWC